MLDIKLIRENPNLIKEGIIKKGHPAASIDEVLKIDKKWRELKIKEEQLRKERNKLTKDDIKKGKKIKEELHTLEPKLNEIKERLDGFLSSIPNLPLPQVPVGKNEKDNVEIKRWGTPLEFDFKIKDHLELGKNLKILDFETGAKVTGSQFYFLYNEGVLLELALVQFALKLLMNEGFTLVITPDLAKSRYYLGTGYLPKGNEAQTYTIEGQDLGLIATAEVALAGKHADEIIPEDRLPLKYVGYSHCFRQEAGSYGKYSRGMYRVHQFSKVEMFIYCLPEESEKMQRLILSLEEKIYQDLGIPYRVVEICTGDLGAMAARKFDFEAWMPGRNEYGEMTSTSNCTDYQARNLNIRLRKKNGKVEFLHMLNGTAIATSRTIIAILENYQKKDGSIIIPEVLQPLIGKKRILIK